jgi:hypothetical protein
MQKQHVTWAQQHDWYMGSTSTDSGLMVVARDDMGDGVVRFIDFQELREWAGY